MASCFLRSLTGAPLAPQPEDFPLRPPCLPCLKGTFSIPALVPHTKASQLHSQWCPTVPQLCGQERARGPLLYSGVSSEALGSCLLHFAEVLTPAQGLQLVAIFLSPTQIHSAHSCLAGWLGGLPSGANGPPGRIQMGNPARGGQRQGPLPQLPLWEPSCPPSLNTTAQGLPIPVTCMGPGRFLHRPSRA